MKLAANTNEAAEDENARSALISNESEQIVEDDVEVHGVNLNANEDAAQDDVRESLVANSNEDVVEED